MMNDMIHQHKNSGGTFKRITYRSYSSKMSRVFAPCLTNISLLDKLQLSIIISGCFIVALLTKSESAM